jgi:hypothetical protein
MSDAEEAQRRAVEDPLFLVGRMLVDLELLTLRVDQGRARGLEALLAPAAEQLEEWRSWLATVQEFFGAEWKKGNREGWHGPG